MNPFDYKTYKVDYETLQDIRAASPYNFNRKAWEEEIKRQVALTDGYESAKGPSEPIVHNFTHPIIDRFKHFMTSPMTLRFYADETDTIRKMAIPARSFRISEDMSNVPLIYPERFILYYLKYDKEGLKMRFGVADQDLLF